MNNTVMDHFDYIQKIHQVNKNNEIQDIFSVLPWSVICCSHILKLLLSVSHVPWSQPYSPMEFVTGNLLPAMLILLSLKQKGLRKLKFYRRGATEEVCCKI
jgi:hypothetical protein